MTTAFLSFAFKSFGGTADRTLPDRLAEVINVKEFGAKGDGVTDDWAAITAALVSTSYYAVVASHVYSGAIRVVTASWSSGTVTIGCGTQTHNLTNGDQILVLSMFSSGQDTYNGLYSVTVVNSNTFTYPVTLDPLPSSGDPGYFVPAVASATWSGNVATINFNAPHTLASGIEIIIFGTDTTNNGFGISTGITGLRKDTTMTVSGAISGTGGVVRLTVNSSASTQTGETITVAGVGGTTEANGTRVATVVDATHIELQGITFVHAYTSGGTVTNHTSLNGHHTPITVTGARQITFALTGSGTLFIDPLTVVQAGPAIVSIVSATVPAAAFHYFIQENSPTCYASSFLNGALESGMGTTTLHFEGADTVFWGDINAGDTIRIGPKNIGVIYFPPGDYLITQPILLNIPDGQAGSLIGYGAKIRGNFANWLVDLNPRVDSTGPFEVLGLTFQNDDVSMAGGGLRMVMAAMSVKDCTFKCGGTGLRTAGSDYRNAVGFNVQVENCVFLPASGAVTPWGYDCYTNNGIVSACYFKGLDHAIGFINGLNVIAGCSFIDCSVGVEPGHSLSADSGSSGNVYQGNHFKNCGTAFKNANGSTIKVQGQYIEGGASATYGWYGAVGYGQMRGIDVSGAFATAAIAVIDSGFGNKWNTWRSVSAANSGAGVAWSLPSFQFAFGQFENNNTPFVTSYSGICGRNITSATYSAGTVTLTCDANHNFDNWSQPIIVSGVTVGGSLNNSYNGIYLPITDGVSSPTITYAVTANPGASADANTGCVTAGGGFLGKSVPISTIVWSAGTVTVTTLGRHGLPNNIGGVSAMISDVTVGSVSSGFNGTFTCTYVDDFSYTYPLVGNPGTADGSCLCPSIPYSGNARSTVSPTTFIWRFSAQGAGRYNISDGAKKGGGTAAIGDLVTGGGSQHIEVAWTSNGPQRSG